MSSELSALIALGGVFVAACWFTFMVGVRRGRVAEMRRWRTSHEEPSNPKEPDARDQPGHSVPAATAMAAAVLAVIIFTSLIALFFAFSQ